MSRADEREGLNEKLLANTVTYLRERADRDEDVLMDANSAYTLLAALDSVVRYREALEAIAESKIPSRGRGSAWHVFAAKLQSVARASLRDER